VSGTRILQKGRVLSVPRARLKVSRGKDKGKLLELDGTGPVLVGTDPDAELLLADDSVSRRHCEIAATPEGWRVRDLGSTNGVRLDGVRVLSALLDGKLHTLKVGESELEWRRFDDAVEHPLSLKPGFELLVGESPAMRALYLLMERAAASDATVLVVTSAALSPGPIARAPARWRRRRAAPSFSTRSASCR
jgi:hypothetical protein